MMRRTWAILSLTVSSTSSFLIGSIVNIKQFAILVVLFLAGARADTVMVVRGLRNTSARASGCLKQGSMSSV